MIFTLGVSKGCTYILCYKLDEEEFPRVGGMPPPIIPIVLRRNLQEPSPHRHIPMIPLIQIRPASSATTVHSPLHKKRNDFTDIDLDSSISDSEQDNYECSICLCSEKNDLVTIICMHVFHKDCISEWVKFDKSCPLCRTNMLTGSPAGSDIIV